MKIILKPDWDQDTYGLMKFIHKTAKITMTQAWSEAVLLRDEWRENGHAEREIAPGWQGTPAGEGG